MLPDRVSNPGPLTYESGALPIVLRGPALTLRYQELTVEYLLTCKLEQVWYNLTLQHKNQFQIKLVFLVYLTVQQVCVYNLIKLFH